MLVYSTNAGLQYKARINFTYLKMSFKYFRFISTLISFYIYEPKTICILKTTQRKWREIYGKYAHFCPGCSGI